MAYFDMEGFTTRAANNLYDAYKAKRFDASSDFTMGTEALLKNTQEHLKLFEEISYVILIKIAVKFGVEPMKMATIWGNRNWAYQIMKDEIKTVVKFKLFENEQIKQEKKDGAMVLRQCDYCSEKHLKTMQCGGCKKARYCDATCQKADWKNHKKCCSKKH